MARTLKFILPFLGVAAILGVAWLLHREIAQYDYRSVVRELHAVPRSKIAAAIALTALSYLLLVGYDALALRQLGRSPGFLRTAFASFTAYVLSYNVGLSVVSGSAVRFRLYSAWHYSRQEIARVIIFTSTTFWAGLFAASGLLLAAGHGGIYPSLGLLSDHLRAVGGLMLALVAAYLCLCAVRREPLAVGRWRLPLPPWPVATGQCALGATDILVAGLVAWVLMPAGWPWENFLGVYLLGMVLGLLSHLPGGIGVLETVLLYGRPAGLSGPAILGAILLYRVIYYLAPLGVAVALLGTHEMLRQRRHLRRFSLFAGRSALQIAPHLFAAMAFLAGLVLLLSGAVPAVHARLAWLTRLLPLPVVEISHLFASVIGLFLLLVARGLQRRLDGAYVLTLVFLAAGVVFSLLKGADWEEASFLLAVMLLLLPCRAYFYRHSALFEVSFTPGWIISILGAIAATIWLGFFVYHHVDYSHDLWWQFALRGDAPRFLRATMAIVVVGTAFIFRRLLHPAPMPPPLPDAAMLERAGQIVAASPDTNGYLALVGDKSLLFSASGRSLIMVGIAGRTWIALGDPIGPREEWEDLVWSFRELSDRHGAVAAFYEVATTDLSLYLDLGFSLTKLGELARVPLPGFSLEGAAAKGLRHTWRRVEQAGAVFEWVDVPGVPALLPELRAVSDAWLEGRREKGFSLGFFKEDYLARTPAAVVRQAGRIIAFANVWCGADRVELSIDLMRHTPDAPRGVMDFLLTNLMLRAAREGFQWFNLGMAPLSGLKNRNLAPLEHRFGALLFEHGERLYHFQGLRAFKEKYHPEWSPRYLACPGAFALPRVLASATKLISRAARSIPS
jgi:phosphatidylglycerol lysyltransferase